MTVEENHIEYNGIRKAKRLLSTEIIKHVRHDTHFPEELTMKLLAPLAKMLQH